MYPFGKHITTGHIYVGAKFNLAVGISMFRNSCAVFKVYSYIVL